MGEGTTEQKKEAKKGNEITPEKKRCIKILGRINWKFKNV